LFNPEKSYDLLVYAKKMALAFAKFGSKKQKRCKDTYTLNVLQYVDVSASERRENSESSVAEDFAAESTTS